MCPYNILISDDDEEVHKITEMLLKRLTFEGEDLVFYHAYNEQQTRDLLQSSHQFAVIFLDVVMDTNHSGLDLVKFIRSDLNDQHIRIIMRTGNPGDAPESRIMMDYDINDYKLKTELTHQKLTTCIYQALRSYRDIKILLEQQKTMQFKDQIVAILSHDLRSPLSSIVSSLNLIGSDCDFASFQYLAARGVFEQLKTTAQGSLNLLEDLLIWYKKDSKTMNQYGLEDISLHDLMKDLVPLYRSIAKDKRIQINYVPQNVDAARLRVRGNTVIVATAIRNILSNAIKFSHRGSKIDIQVEIGPETNLGCVRIIDYGVGMAQEKIVQLFDDKKNYQESERGTEGEAGIGIGLHLSRHMIDLCGGHLEVTSSLNKGTTVSIFFERA